MKNFKKLVNHSYLATGKWCRHYSLPPYFLSKQKTDNFFESIACSAAQLQAIPAMCEMMSLKWDILRVKVCVFALRRHGSGKEKNCAR